MRNLIYVSILLMFSTIAFGQSYMSDVHVNANQSLSKQYISIALGGKRLLSNQKLPNSKYDTKGTFSSVYLPDFIDKVTEIVAQQINGCDYISCDTVAQTMTISQPDAITIHSDNDMTLTSDSIHVNGKLSGTITSGVYKPTRSAEVNTATVTTDTAQYMRVGNTVTVSGSFTSDPTSTTTETSFLITLPIASAITTTEQVSGTAYCQAIGVGGSIFADVSGDKAKIDWFTTADVASHKWSFTFTYRIK